MLTTVFPSPFLAKPHPCLFSVLAYKQGCSSNKQGYNFQLIKINIKLR